MLASKSKLCCVLTTFKCEYQIVSNNPLHSSSPTLNQPVNQPTKDDLGARKKFAYDRGNIPIPESHSLDIQRWKLIKWEVNMLMLFSRELVHADDMTLTGSVRGKFIKLCVFTAEIISKCVVHALRKACVISCTLKKCSLLKIGNSSSWVNFAHFREKTSLLAVQLFFYSSSRRV